MPEPNRSPTVFMPAISGPSITCSGRPPPARMACQHSSVSATMKSVMPCTSACARRSPTVPARQASLLVSSLAAPFTASATSSRRSVASGAPIEHHVLDALAQRRLDVVVDADHAGVDDAHVHAGLDRVVQEHGVDRLAHRLVAAEAEAHVADAARHLGAGQVLLDPACGLDEVDRVVRMLLDAGGDREDVRIEDDVLGRKADLVDEDAIGRARRSASCARSCRPGPARRRPSPPRPRRSGAPAWPGGGTRPRLPSARSS